MGSRIASRLTLRANPFSDPKDAIKFLCKEMWQYVFGHQASRLQANRKGQFVIHDIKFPALQNLSNSTQTPVHGAAQMLPSLGPLSHPMLISSSNQLVEDGSPSSTVSRRSSPPSESMSEASYKMSLLLLQVPSGLLEGFLESAGFPCSVEGTVQGCIPACSFNITIPGTFSTISSSLSRSGSD